MPIATYRGEASVGDLADRLYLRLTPAKRKQAEARKKRRKAARRAERFND